MTVLSRPNSVSFEFFPPASEAAHEQLWRAIERLSPLAPRFVSVTYGADGSTRERTFDVIRRLHEHTTLTPVPHLTCVDAGREDIDTIARRYHDMGIRHIVALRGDPPQGSRQYRPRADGYAFAADLVAGLRRVADFDITVAAYPETHPEAPDADFDVDNLKRKLDAGASRSITQFFFDNEVFLRFRDRCAARGIQAPIIPGILPITRFPQLERFAKSCGASVPDWLRQRFDGLDDDAETRKMIAASVAIEQVQALQREGVDEFHFYTLNRAETTYAICHALGVRPGREAA